MCMAVTQRGRTRSQRSRCRRSVSAERLALDGASLARATLRPSHEHVSSDHGLGLVQFGLTVPAGDEDIGSLVYESFGCRQPDSAAAALMTATFPSNLAIAHPGRVDRQSKRQAFWQAPGGARPAKAE